MTIICPKCQTENPADSKFCKECATPFPSADKIPAHTETLEVPKAELTTGSTFAGRYQIIEELGKGGMGRVYKALDKEVNAKIALKLIKPEIAAEDKTIERFRNELKTARDIAHKNVCRMYDLNREEGSYYITMEYVTGEDLKSFIRRSKQLAIGTAISIAKQVCEGLVEAHKSGVVHRDLKPSNIMIDSDGNARIMDFGIARSIKGKGITGAGVMVGTPEYMSPEQVEGKDVDQRSDIYSLGVILYEMVTGRVPFEGDTGLSVAVKHKTESPKNPQEFNTQISDDLSRLILKCLEKDKSRRYQSAGEVRSELANIEKGIPTTQKIAPEKKPLTSREITVQLTPKKILIPVLIFAGIIIVGLVLWKLLPREAAVPVSSAKPSVAVMYFKNNTGDQGLDHWSEMLTGLLIKDLIQSKYIRVLSEDKLVNILESQNQLEARSYSTDVLKEIVSKGRVNHILQGNYAKAGDVYRVNVTLQEAANMEIISSEGVEGTGEDSIFSMVDDLTRRIKKNFKLSSKAIASDIDRDVGKITTSSPEAYKFYREGIKVDDKGDHRLAIQLFEKAVAVDPEFASAYIAMGIAYYNLGLYAEEKKYLQKAMELGDRVSDHEKYLSQGEFYSTSEKTYHKAIEAFEQLLELYPENDEGNAELGWIYQTVQQYDRAIELYEVNFQNRIENVYAYTNLSACYRAKGMYDKSRKVLETYLDELGDNVRIRHLLAINYIELGELDLAMAEVDKAFLLDPGHRINFMIKGGIYEYKGHFEEAEAEYQKLLKAREPVGRAWHLTRLSYLSALRGKYEEALELLKQGVELSEKLGQKVWTVNYHLSLSYLFLNLNRPENALKECDTAYRMAVEEEYVSSQQRALFMKGRSHLMMGAIDKALAVAGKLKTLIEMGLNKHHMRRYHHLMAWIEIERKNYSKAIDYAKKTLALSFYSPLGKSATYYNVLAMAYYKAGDLEQARQQYEMITRLTSGRLAFGDIYAKSYYMLGKIHEEQGDKAKAIANYEKLLDLWKNADPGLSEVDDAKKRLTGLT